MGEIQRKIRKQGALMDTHDAKNIADGAAVAVGVSNFMQWFPPVVGLVTGLLTMVWFAIRIY